MFSKTYTKEEKTEYYKGLRNQWKAAKEYAENNQEAKALHMEAGLGSISIIGFSLVLRQMRAAGFDGIPYVDAKTFQKWREAGFKVRKGEKSRLHGLTWISAEGKREEKETETETETDEKTGGYAFPKVYHLFHKSQIEERG